MRYRIDENNYITDVYFNCHSGYCTAYVLIEDGGKGTIPDGYETLEEWAENANIRAYKIVDGNLVFDSNRDEILRTQFEKEEEDNRYVCYKEISNLTNLVKSDNADNYLKSKSILSNFIEVTDSNKFASSYIELRTNENISNKLHIKFNNGNLLTNEATSKMDSGIYFEVNTDRTIYIEGTATNDIEYDIAGYPNNTKPILAFKKGINYYLSSNGHQIKMYNYDGADRTEIYSGNGGVINFTDSDKKVTQIVLFIANETEIKTTLKPMLNIGDTAKEYITYEGSDTVVYLGENTFTRKDIIEIEDGWATLKSVQYPSSDIQATKGLKPSEGLTPSETLTPSNELMTTVALYPSNETYVGYTKIEYLEDVIMPNTYLDLTYMYCMEDVKLQTTYPNTQRNNDLTGYETPNGGFAIDEEGNMYCNNANIKGSTIVNGGNFSVNPDGNMTCNNANIRGSAIVNGENFSVDEQGNMKCNDATINGGDITLKDTQSKAKMSIVDENNENVKTTYASRYIKMTNESGYALEAHNSNFNQLYLKAQNGGFIDINNDNSRNYIDFTSSDKNKKAVIYNSNSGNQLYLDDYSNDAELIMSSKGSSDNNPYFKISKGSAYSSISQNGVWSPSFNNNSLESKKKNINLDDGCLQQILETDICSFNWKFEDDEDQKHIGLIIPDKGGNYRVSPKVLTHDKDAVDLYSMVGMAWKSIQEMYDLIKEKDEKIKELEEIVNGFIKTN